MKTKSEEKVLSALSTAAWNLRKKLGKSLSTDCINTNEYRSASTTHWKRKGVAMGNENPKGQRA